MPLKIVDDSEGLKHLTPGVAVPKSFIHRLVNQYYDRTKKRRRAHNPGTPPDHMGQNDARSCWFPYKELEALFNQNGFTEAQKELFGLRIYFGLHDKNDRFHDDPNGNKLPNPNYDEQHTVILVVTKKENEINNDQLRDNVNSLSYGGMGLDLGSLCPPDCKGGETW
jgi:hypothetical protein